MSDRQGQDDQTQVQDRPRSAQVLRLADFDRTQPTRVLAEMRDYWDRLRRDRAVPSRADVEPAGIRHALDYAFILERIAPGAARFRLAGRHLIDLMGMEVRGMPICSFLNPGSRGRLSDVLESVFKAPQIAEMQLHARSGYARPELSARLLLLPLRSDLGDVTRALGCLIAEGETGVAPRRFDLIDDTVMPIIEGGKIIEPSPSSRAAPDQPKTQGRGQDAAARPDPAPSPTPPDRSTPEGRRAMFRLISTDSG